MLKSSLSNRRFFKSKTVKTILIGGMLGIIAGTSFLGLNYYECNVAGPLCFFALSNMSSGPSEMIILDHYSIHSGPNQQYPTILTVWINNIGKSSVNVLSVYVGNSTGSHYGGSFGISITSGTMVNATLDGTSSGFHFTTGQIYWISFTTTRYQSTFTISY